MIGLFCPSARMCVTLTVNGTVLKHKDGLT